MSETSHLTPQTKPTAPIFFKKVLTAMSDNRKFLVEVAILCDIII